MPAASRESGPYRAAAPLPVSFPERKIPGSRATRHIEAVPHCPRCNSALHGAHGEVDSVAAVLECGSCRGLFVAHSVLEDTLRERRGGVYEVGAPVDTMEVRYLACPRCAERMSRRLFGRKSGLVVDVCSMHGIWFDRGEAEQAADVPPEARTEVPLPGAPHRPPHAAKTPALPPEAARAWAAAETELRKESMRGTGLDADGAPKDLLEVLIRLFLG